MTRSRRSAGRSPCAYVTLVTNDEYAIGARALVRSLRLSGTKADIVVLFSEEIAAGQLTELEPFDVHLVLAEPLPLSEEFRQRHSRDELHTRAPFDQGSKPKFHDPLGNFSKLRLWQLTEYEKVVFIDCDALVLRNCDRLFSYPAFSAAPNVYSSLADFRRMNSGVFVASPDRSILDAMLVRLEEGGRFWRRTDQTFLQEFFPEWHGLPIYYNMLQYVWFNLPQLWDWAAIRILHFQYEKPWQDNNPLAEKLAPLIELWRVYAGDGQPPDPGELVTPS